MADSNIGALPQAPQLDDDSLLVAEQQGQAMKVTGAQFKEFGRQAVIGQVQGYVDAAEKAASEAVDAVSAVTGMTVSARSSQEAEVSKSTVAGKVHLTFGLPRGEKGEPGPEGPQGLRGPQGAPGNGLTILGHYDTEEELRAAVTAPEAGNAYSVGTQLPYDIWVYDGVTGDWRNYGPLSGGGGTILPGNVVTTPGGAEMTFSSGDGPHTIEFDFEEEPPLTAGDIVYGEGTVQEALSELFASGSEGKSLIASAVTAKGVETAADATFAEMAANIGQITTGGDTSDATATPGDILAGKTAYTAAGKVEGIVPTLAARTYTPGTADQVIANGQYLGGSQTIKGDPNLTSGSIKKGVSIFGVAGAVESSFQATLTVKADVGAVVTATNGDTTVEALSTTGTVTIELPHEGTWKVTAQRGMAQYNTVVIEVSSQYSAELTAEVHVEYYIKGTVLCKERYMLTGASIGDHALFIGGTYLWQYTGTDVPEARVAIPIDSYDENLTHEVLEYIAEEEASTYAWYSTTTAGHVFAVTLSRIITWDIDLTRTGSFSLNHYCLDAVSIGNYALFGTRGSNIEKAVEVISDDLVKSESLPMLTNRYGFKAAANDNYAIFAGGTSGIVDAYDKNLIRTNPTVLSVADIAPDIGVCAGNYVLIVAGVNGFTDAYDLFLTRTTIEPLKSQRRNLAATTLKGVAIIGGGNTLKEGYVGTTTGSSYFTRDIPDPVDDVEIYDQFLVRTEIQELSNKRYSLAAASVGEYAIFAGGAETRKKLNNVYYPATVDTVDVYRYV